MSAAPGGCFSAFKRLVGTLIAGWIAGSVLLVGGYAAYVQLQAVDTWAYRVPIARWLTMGRWVSFAEVLPSGALPNDDQSVKRLDTDGDGRLEWVVVYQYDRSRVRSPVAVAIYDDDRGSPPVLYPYRLVLPDRDYLSESPRVTVDVGDFIKSDGTGKPEILVRGAGPPDEVAIFRYDESRKAAAWMDPRDYPSVYRCVGYFRGDGYVKLPDANGDVVVVRRLVYDRAQLGVKEVYAYDPARDSYLLADSKTLMPPKEQSIDFAFGVPSDVESSPYPEKVVLAYYQRLASGGASSLLSAAAQSAGGVAASGLPVPPDQVAKVLVQSIGYTPGSENQAFIGVDGVSRTGAVVHVEFFYWRHGDPQQYKQKVNWFLVQERGKWRLDHIEP